MNKITEVRNEIMVLSKDIQNPAVDRRAKRKWHKREVIKAGTRLRFKVKDQTEYRRKMLRGRLTEEQMANLPTEHLVEISNDDCYAFNRLSFYITYEQGSETGDCEFDDDVEGELAKLLWEACQPAEKNASEIVEEVIGGCSPTHILVALLEMGRITRQDLEDAYNAPYDDD